MIFLSMLLLGLILLIVALTLAMSQMLIAPTRMTDPKAVHLLKRLSPGDLGMRFEEVSFNIRDEQTGNPMKIAGWWIPGGKDEGGKTKDEGGRMKDEKVEARSDDPALCSPALHPSSFSLQPSLHSFILHPFPSRTVVILHGFADAKVGSIAWAPLWQSLGFNILAIDLRAHGESGGRFSTAGFFERHDVEAVINELRAVRPQETQELVLFGVSLGAAVAAAVAERRSDLTAVILDSPYHHFAAAAKAHGRYMNLPFHFLSPPAIALGEWRCGANFDEVAPDRTLPNLKCPSLLIFGEDDALVDGSQFTPQDSENAVGKVRVVIRIKNAGHVLGIATNPTEYRNSVARFLEGIQ